MIGDKTALFWGILSGRADASFEKEVSDRCSACCGSREGFTQMWALGAGDQRQGTRGKWRDVDWGRLEPSGAALSRLLIAGSSPQGRGNRGMATPIVRNRIFFPGLWRLAGRRASNLLSEWRYAVQNKKCRLEASGAALTRLLPNGASPLGRLRQKSTPAFVRNPRFVPLRLWGKAWDGWLRTPNMVFFNPWWPRRDSNTRQSD